MLSWYCRNGEEINDQPVWVDGRDYTIYFDEVWIMTSESEIMVETEMQEYELDHPKSLQNWTVLFLKYHAKNGIIIEFFGNNDVYEDYLLVPIECRPTPEPTTHFPSMVPSNLPTKTPTRPPSSRPSVSPSRPPSVSPIEPST